MASPDRLHRPVRIFYSYAHEDKALLDVFRGQLYALKRQGLIDDWYDGQIGTGEYFDEEIWTHLNKADIILLLVSADYIASESCMSEMQRALERLSAGTAHVIPIILRPCLWDTLAIADLQLLPTDKNRNVQPITGWGGEQAQERAWFEVAKEVRSIIDHMQSGTLPVGNDTGHLVLRTYALSNEQQGKSTKSDLATLNISHLQEWTTAFAPPYDEALLPSPDHFIGRTTEIEMILRHLHPDEKPAVALIQGPAGIGKSALAAQVIQEAMRRHQFTHGIGVVQCAMLTDPADVLARVISRFDPYRRRPMRPGTEHLDKLNRIARSMLQGKKCLVVLNDINTILPLDRVVQPLLDARVAVLLVRRPPHEETALTLTVVPTTHVCHLGPLADHDGLRLLALSRQISSENVDIVMAGSRILKLLNGHPLAIKVEGAIAADSGQTLEELAQQLEQRRAIMQGDYLLEDYYEGIIQNLPAAAQQLCIAMSVFEGVDVGEQALVAVGGTLGISASQVVRLLDLLRRRGLIQESVVNTLLDVADRKRISLHPLFASAARTLFNQWSSSRQDSAYKAMAEHYSRYTNYIRTINERALNVDLQNISGALEWAHTEGQHELVVHLCSGMYRFWLDRWMTADGLHYLSWCFDPAAIPSDESNASLEAANLEFAYARFLRRSGQLDVAEQALRKNLESRRILDDPDGEGLVLHQLAYLARSRGQLDTAEAYCQQGQQVERISESTKAYLLAELGRIYRAKGNLRSATEYFERALSLFRDLDDVANIGVVRGYLGRIARTRGILSVAEDHFRVSLSIAHDLEAPRAVGIVLSQLGRIARNRGKLEDAERFFNDSIQIAHEVQDRQTEGVDLGYLGRVLRTRGRLRDAKERFLQSLAIAREVQDHQNESVALGYLARVERDLLHLDQSDLYLKEAAIIAKRVQDHRGEAILLAQQGQNALLQGNLEAARALLEKALNKSIEIEDRRGQCIIYGLIGQVALKTGSPWEAEGNFAREYVIASELGDRRIQATGKRWLGITAEMRNDFDQAEKCLRTSKAATQRLGSKLDYVESCVELGRFLIERHQSNEAGCKELANAIEICEDLQLPKSAEKVRRRARELGCSI